MSGVSRCGSTDGERSIDLTFEWHQLCHGCGNRKWFNGIICEECRDRHDV